MNLMKSAILAGVMLGLTAASLSFAPRQAMAQRAGDDGDCDDVTLGVDGEPALLVQLGCARDQINNLTVIYQADVIRRIVGARLAEPPGRCTDPNDNNCTEVDGLLISPVADTAVSTQRLWNTWVDVKNTWIEPGHNDLLPTQGTLFNGSAGVDYKLNDKVVLGLVSSFESSDTDTGGPFTGNTDSHGFGGGAYAGITLADNLIFNAMAAGTWIDTDNTYTGISANVDSSRVQLSGGLTKYWYIGQTRITPSVQISWSKEYQDSFVDSTSALNPEQTLESAIATSGTTIGHTFALSNGQTIEPWIAGNLDWTIYSEIKTDGIGKTNLGEFLDARIQAGFNWSIAQNAQFTASGEIGGLIHPDQDTYAGELNLAIQF